MQLEMGISEVAREVGVSIDTIRRWDKKGLLRSRRDEQNHRLFSVDAVRRVAAQASGQSKGELRVLKNLEQTFTSVDLFAGAGGTALGLENAGFHHLLLSEWDKYACATLRRNRPSWNVVEGDVASVSFEELRGKVDLVEGGFPCQAFSYAGKKMGFEDTRGTMFYEFARAISETMPRVAIGENVKGLLNHDDGRTLRTMIEVLEGIRDELGRSYHVAFKVLRSQYLDVPQKRERLVIACVRSDVFSGDFCFPTENEYVVTVRDALANCPDSPGATYPPRKREILSLVPPGGNWRDLPDELQREFMAGSYSLGGGKTGIARRLAWDEPSLTLTCAPAQKQTERCHPSETRPLSTREYARIQTFPDEWEFEGSMNQVYKQIGNAVPVNLGFHIGMMVREILERSAH